MKAPTQADIARELGITRAALSKLKKRGMPVHSADAARAWRAANLHPGRMVADPGPSPRTVIERLHALWPLALSALQAGRFELVADELRRALRAVPQSHRDQVLVCPEAMDALLGQWVLAELRGDSATGAAVTTDESEPIFIDEVPYTVGDIAYMLASGELQLLP